MTAVQATIAALLLVSTWWLTDGQARPNGGISGSGSLSPSVVATYEGRGNLPAGPVLLDLLVLWRGTPGWFDENNSAGVGGPDGVHRLAFGSRAVQLRFDSGARAVHVAGQVVALADDNVLLLDEVDSNQGIRVVGTLRVEPRLAAGAPTGSDEDPLDALVRQSPQLFDYLRCDPSLSEPGNLYAQIQLKHCEHLRPQ
jgi:hypothetical protein